MSEGERLRRAAVDARRREASDGVMREWAGCGYEARAYLDHIIGEEDAPAGHKFQAVDLLRSSLRELGRAGLNPHWGGEAEALIERAIELIESAPLSGNT